MQKGVGSFTHKFLETNPSLMSQAIELFNVNTISRLSDIVAASTKDDFKQMLLDNKLDSITERKSPFVDPWGRSTYFSVNFGSHSIPVYQPGTIAAFARSAKEAGSSGDKQTEQIFGKATSGKLAEFCNTLSNNYKKACEEAKRDGRHLYYDILIKTIDDLVKECIDQGQVIAHLPEYDPVFKHILSKEERVLLFNKLKPSKAAEKTYDELLRMLPEKVANPEFLHLFSYIPDSRPLPITATLINQLTSVIIDQAGLSEDAVSKLKESSKVLVSEVTNYTYISKHLNPVKPKPEHIELATSVGRIEAKEAFNLLEDKEKLYTYWLSRASWEGAKIAYFQRSYESPALLYLFGKIFEIEDIDCLKKRTLDSQILSEDEWKQLTAYAAGVFNNCGNYHSFGDNKFTPEVEELKLLQWIRSTKFYEQNTTLVEEILGENLFEIYEIRKPLGNVGFSDKGGVNSYFSSNCTSSDSEFISSFLKSIDFSPLNTFVVKLNSSNFRILVCSAQKRHTQTHNFKGARFEIEYGLFSSIMERVVGYMKEALKYAANENQSKMIESYINHFETGDIEQHKESQRWWIKDQNPTIETNIGFVETYLDPAGVRAEWEGFVSIVDKLQSKLLLNLVENAEKIIETLPWGKLYEKDEFHRPDFTSLLVVTFASSGTPIGINIPNYDDIRMNEGFKNVNLGNVAGLPKRENLHHMPEHEKDTLINTHHDALFVDVSCHELLGHGTGKLFTKNKDGTFNFDTSKIEGFNEKTTPYYNYNETWSSKFPGNYSSSWEECRAECVALFLGCNQTILETLVPGKEPAYKMIKHAIWISMVYGGIKGMVTYSADNKAWGQAHCQARFAIYKILREHNFVTVNFEEKDGRNYFTFKLKLDEIETEGLKIIGDFLIQLQVIKSHGDFKNGKVFWDKYTALNEEELRMRQIVLDWRNPRGLEVQHNLKLDGEKVVECESFDETFEGVIKSNIEHYQRNIDNVYDEYQKIKFMFRPDHFEREITE